MWPETYVRLVLFLILGSAVYSAVLLLREDWRWNLARVVQFGIVVLTCVAFLAAGRLSGGAIAWSVTVLILFGVLPAWMQHRVWNMMLAGELERARRWQRLMPLICWGRTAQIMGAMVKAAEDIRAGDLPSGLARFGKLLEEASTATRRHVLGMELVLLIALREWHAAVALFEAHFSISEATPSSILYGMTRPYCELGQFERAVRCLAAAESEFASAPDSNLHRALAFTVTYAFTGRKESLERFFRANAHLLRALPKPFPHYWIGICHLARGERDAAVRELETALRLAGKAPAGWHDAIKWRLTLLYTSRPEDGAQPIILSPELEAELNFLETTLPEERRPSRLAPLRNIGPVTLALIVLNAIVLMLMELWGDSSDARTLVRFGANLPALVKEGEHWRLVSSIFIHVGGVHLFFNAYGCYLFGGFIERVCGSMRMFIIYMTSGLVGSAASAWAGRHLISAGASGAVLQDEKGFLCPSMCAAPTSSISSF